MVECKRLDHHMTEALDALNKCIKMLRQIQKSQQEIKNRKYYQALRTIEEIRVEHLRDVTDFEFAKRIGTRSEWYQEATWS